MVGPRLHDLAPTVEQICSEVVALDALDGMAHA